MSASAPIAERCSSCGADLPARARFCPSCGVEIGAERGATLRAELPPTETGDVPISYQRAEPRWFGVPPPYLLLGVVALLLVLAIVLLAGGHWPYALILLGIAALLSAAFLEVLRRRPTNRLRHTSALARERAQSTVETWRARSYAAAEARRIRSGLVTLEAERRSLLHDLGAAVHLGTKQEESTLRGRLAEVDAQEAELRSSLEEAMAAAGERIRRARLPVEETMMVLPSEPTPPPGEADPPQPAVVPEPYPPPDEATPPQPARVPEPGPGPGLPPEEE